MPEGCLAQTCRKCETYIIRNKRLECNFGNRLSVSKSGLSAFLGLSETEVYERKRLKTAAEVERMKKLIAVSEKPTKEEK